MRIFVRILIGCAVALVILVIAALAISYRSYHEGREFSPDDFSVREFSYLKEPLTGIVIRGRTLSSYWLGGIDLVGDGLIKPRIRSPQTWHLVNDNSDIELASRDSDARLLVNYLELTTDRGEYVWDTWNADHPKLAKVFWPAVADLARDELYLVVADVMEFGLDTATTDAKQFKLELDQVMAGAYLKMAQVEFDLGHVARAKTLANKSKQFFDSDEVDHLLIEIAEQSVAASPNPESKL